jgi:hypothetical protein
MFFLVSGLVFISFSLSSLGLSVIRLNMLGATIREKRPDEWALHAAHRYRWLVQLGLGRIKLDVPGDDYSRRLSRTRLCIDLFIFDWIAGLAALVCYAMTGAPNIVD